MFEFFIQFWYLWFLVLIGALFRIYKPTIKGWIGEKTISVYLASLPKDKYIIINNIFLPTETGTTQIDHVVVSAYGIFVIEVKNYKGWIYGSERSIHWTQNIYGKKSTFMNPIHQNYAHVKAVESILTNYPKVEIIPIVAFSANSDLKVETTSHVVYFHRLCGVIGSYTEKILEMDDVKAVANLLQNQSINNADIKKEHVASIESKKAEIETATIGSKCPRCSGTLVERNGKHGKFIGCANYPKCRFTKEI